MKISSLVRRIIIKWSEDIDDKYLTRRYIKIYNMKYVVCYILTRRLIFIGRIVRIQNDKVPARLLSDFYYEKDRYEHPTTLQGIYLFLILKTITLINN